MKQSAYPSDRQRFLMAQRKIAVTDVSVDRMHVTFIGLGAPGWVKATHLPTATVAVLDKPIPGEQGKALLIAMLERKVRRRRKRR